MLFQLELIPHQQRTQRLTSAMQQIRGQIQHIAWAPRQRQRTEREVFKILYRRQDLHEARLPAVLRDPAIVALHPERITTDNFLVCYKQNIPVQLIICNFTQTAKHTSVHTDYSTRFNNPRQCPCQKYACSTAARQVDGHTVLTDLTVL